MINLGIPPVGATPWQVFANRFTPANMAAGFNESLDEGRALLARLGIVGRTTALTVPLVLVAGSAEAAEKTAAVNGVDPQLLAQLESYGGAALLALLAGVATGQLAAGKLSGKVKVSPADEKLMTFLSSSALPELVRELSCHPTFSRAVNLFDQYLAQGQRFRAGARRAKDLAPFGRTLGWVAPPMLIFGLEMLAAKFLGHTPTREEVAGFLAIAGFTADRFGPSVPKNDPVAIRLPRDFTTAATVYYCTGEHSEHIAGAMFLAVLVGYAGDAILSKLASNQKPEQTHDDYLRSERIQRGLVELSGLLFDFFQGTGNFTKDDKFKGKPLEFPDSVLKLVGTNPTIPGQGDKKTPRTERDTDGLMEALVAFVKTANTNTEARFQTLEVALTGWSERMETDLNNVGRLRAEAKARAKEARAEAKAEKAAKKAKAKEAAAS